jgi:hypothetical protein
MAILAENEAIANKNLLALSNSRSNQRELFSFGIAVLSLHFRPGKFPNHPQDFIRKAHAENQPQQRLKTGERESSLKKAISYAIRL